MKMQTVVYSQEMHCCGSSDEEATATLSIQDGGGGEYLVLDASQWSFGDEAEIDELCAAMKKMLATAEK